MENKIVLTDILDKRAEADFNYNRKVEDRVMYDFDYRNRLSFIKFRDILPINPNNNALMVSMGYRHPEMVKETSKGSKSIFYKTDSEKKELKKIKSSIKSFITAKGRVLNSQKSCLDIAATFANYASKNYPLAHNISGFKATNL